MVDLRGLFQPKGFHNSIFIQRTPALSRKPLPTSQAAPQTSQFHLGSWPVKHCQTKAPPTHPKLGGKPENSWWDPAISAGARMSIIPDKDGILQRQAQILKVMKMWENRNFLLFIPFKFWFHQPWKTFPSPLTTTQMSHLKLGRFFILLLLQQQIFAIVWNILPLLLLFLKHSMGNISILTMEF